MDGRTIDSPSAPAATAAADEPTGPLAKRRLWLALGWLCIAIGTIGIVVPLLPTVDCYGLAAYCFARGSRRWEQWLLNHRRMGPMVRDWREHRSVPLGAKCLATLSMTVSCAWAAVVMPARTAWIPASICLLVAIYLWSRPTRVPPKAPTRP